MEEKKSNGKASKVLYIAGLVLLILVILITLGMLVPRLFGIQEYTVVSGSMEPSIHVGSLVFVSKCDPSDIQEGEIIAYRNGNEGAPIVHRVVQNDTSSRQLITKGDANAFEDIFPVSYGQVVGKVVLVVPVIGRIMTLSGG